MSRRLIESRIDSGRRFLRSLATPPWSKWEEGYARYLDDQLEPEESLVLVHPQWFGRGMTQAEIQGGRRFESGEMSRFDPCDARRLWGYACDLDPEGRIEFDHLFPYSLGGPTVAANRLALCHVHNAGKAGDIHLFPWEEGEPRWLAASLARIRNAMTS